jgi:hypothetical protein
MSEPYSQAAHKGGLFYLTSVGGRAFAGFFTNDGPSILDIVARDHVALVVCHLRRSRGSWAITKYQDEERIRLPGFTDADAIRLAGEFGILPAGFDDDDDTLRDLANRYGSRLEGVRYNMLSQDEEAAFIGSPAWSALREWAARDSETARRESSYRTYIDWFDKLQG